MPPDDETPVDLSARAVASVQLRDAVGMPGIAGNLEHHKTFIARNGWRLTLSVRARVVVIESPYRGSGVKLMPCLVPLENVLCWYEAAPE